MIFAAFTTPPTMQRKLLIDRFVKALKLAGVWPLLDVLYMFAAADSQAALINWKNPGTLTASPVSSPTFTADRGFTGNGTTSYIDSTFNPTVGSPNFSTAGASVLGRIQTSSGSNHCVVGTSSLSKPAYTSGASGIGAALIYASFYSSGAGEPGSAGFYTYTEQSFIGSTYTNGSLAGTQTGLTGPASLSNTTLLTLRRTTDFSTDTMASFGAGGFLTAAQVASESAAELAYMQGVGAA